MPDDKVALVRRLTTLALTEPRAVLSLAPRELDLTVRLLRRARLLGHLASRLSASVELDALPHPLGDHLLSALISAEARSRVGLWELDRIAAALDAGRSDTAEGADALSAEAAPHADADADAESVPNATNGADLPNAAVGADQLVALKGCAYLLAGTPNAAGRTFNDVDLLVPKAALTGVEERLKEHGWRSAEVSAYDDRYYRQWAHELPPLRHREREVETDLHHSILMATARFQPDPGLLLTDARTVPDSRFRVLSPVDMTLHAITHLFLGEMEEGLRELVDIDQLLRHFGDREPQFWQRFWPRAEQLDLARPAFYGLRYTVMALGTPVPEAVLRASKAAAPPAPVLTLMDRLLPDALFPPHPDATTAGRFVPAMLLVRAHWLRMPPLTLARHLGYKFYLKHRPRKAGEA